MAAILLKKLFFTVPALIPICFNWLILFPLELHKAGSRLPTLGKELDIRVVWLGPGQQTNQQNYQLLLR
jgi:hypothetical protein